MTKFVEMSGILKTEIQKLVDSKYPQFGLGVVVVPFGEGARVTVFKTIGTGIFPVATAGIHSFEGDPRTISGRLWEVLLARSRDHVKYAIQLASKR